MPDAPSDRHRLIRTPTRWRTARRSTMGWDTVGIGRPMASVENRRLETKCRQALIIQGLFYMVAEKSCPRLRQIYRCTKLQGTTLKPLNTMSVPAAIGWSEVILMEAGMFPPAAGSP